MKTLNIDLETRSSVPIKYGVHRYVDSPDFEILLFAYSVNHGPVKILDLANGDEISRKLMYDLEDEAVIKTAFNASFERTCLRAAFNYTTLDANQWRDTMIHGMELGLPASLGEMAKTLSVPEQKDTEGKRLIKKFCTPPFADPTSPENKADWELFKSYCKQDVRTEMSIADQLDEYPLPDSEWKLWAMDQEINDRGIQVDLELVKSAISLNNLSVTEAKERLSALTGLDNPNSVSQLKTWLSEHGCTLTTLGAEAVKEALSDTSLDPDARQALELRQQLSGTAVKKYEMLDNATTSDGGIHGILQFYGASRTGRWAGRLLQVQNLPRGSLHPTELDDARYFVKQQDAEALELLGYQVPEVLKSLIRSALVPSKGNKFLVADFSAIEARVIAWLAGEKWVLDTFRVGNDIYKATANQMFKLGGVDKVDKAMRQRGKVATLALGYQGGVGALKAMGALKMGVREEELPELVNRWRKANPHIVSFWQKIENAAKDALNYGVKIHVQGIGAPVEFNTEDKYLTVKLPSDRKLYYLNARLEDDRISYEGKSQAALKFTRLETYGGKLTENIVQAIARDMLGEAMLRLEEAGYPIVAHIHDEVIIDAPSPILNPRILSLQEAIRIMTKSPSWAPDIPLAAAGFESLFYMKA